MAGVSEAAGGRARQGVGTAVWGGAAEVAARLAARAAARPWALPLAGAVLGVALRVWLVARTHAMIDGDEAMVGLQAEGILRGHFPTYFYGQPYMGSLEAYLVAPLVALLGPSGWALRLEPIALSPLLVYLTWRLARALLPAEAPSAPLLAGLAALVAGVPPLYDAVAELRAWGGQIELYVVTLALLLCVVELADRLRAGTGRTPYAPTVGGATPPRAGGRTPYAPTARRWLILGFLAGLGIWINPLIVFALAAGAIWLAGAAVLARRDAIRRTRAGTGAAAGTAKPRAGGRAPAAWLAAALLPGLAVGGLPAWLYAARHAGENLLVYVTQPTVSPAVSGAARHGRIFLGAAITARYVTCVAPNVLDGRLPTETPALLPLRLLLLVPPVAGIAGGLWLLRRGAPGAVRVGLPLLYACVVTAVFCLGTSAWASTKACSLDLAGRYAVPLAMVEPLLLLAALALPAALAEWGVRRRVGAAGGVANGRDGAMGRGAAATAGDAVKGAANAAGAAAGDTMGRWLTTAGGGVALLALLAGGVLQAGTYATASPTQTFQSPYYHRIPAEVGGLLTYLRAHDIHAAWCNHWLGNIVTYRSDGATVCADYYDQVYSGGIQRPPGTVQTVEAAPRASFILILTAPRPCLARELDARGIGYSMQVMPSEGVTVITPNRTVDPATVLDGLGQDYTEQSVQGSACSNAAIAPPPASTPNSRPS